MRATTAGAKRRWAVAGLGALIVAALVFALLGRSRPPAPRRAPPRPRPAIELAERRGKSALDDEATLLDPTALFQPTRWSTAQLEVSPPEANGTFQSFREPPKLLFAERDLKLGEAEPANGPAGALKLRTSLELPPPVAVPEKVVDTFAGGLPGAIGLGFGRTDRPVPALEVRGPSIDVVEMNSGRAALAPRALTLVQARVAESKPPGNRPWQVLEFVAAVDSAGLAAPLTITRRSGVEEVDAYFQNFLSRTLRIGEHLTPGFYRISVGP